MAESGGWIGVITAIQKNQAKNADLAAKEAAFALDLQQKTKIKEMGLNMDLDFQTDPRNIYRINEAEVKGNVIQETLSSEYKLPEIAGVNKGREESAKDITVKNQKYYNNLKPMPGNPDMTFGQFYEEGDVLQSYYKINARKKMNMPFLEQEKLNGDAAQAVGLPRSTPQAEVSNYISMLETRQEIAKNNTLFNTPVQDGGGLPQQVESYFTTEADRMKSNEELVGNLATLKQQSPNIVLGKITDYDVGERLTLAKDIVAVNEGKVNRHTLNELQIKQLNKINKEKGLGQVNSDLPYITFDKISKYTLKNDSERNIAAKSVIDQYTALPDEVFKTLNSTTQNKIIKNIAQAGNVLFQANENFEMKDGKLVVKQGYVVNLNDMGLQLNQAPKYVKKALKTITTDEEFVPTNTVEGAIEDNTKVTIYNEKENTLERVSTDLTRELINEIFPPIVASIEQRDITPDMALTHIVRSHAIANDNDLDEYIKDGDLLGEAVAQASLYRNRAQASHALAPALFTPDGKGGNTLLLHRSIVNRKVLAMSVAKAALYSREVSKKGPAVIAAGLQIDPYIFYKTQGDLFSENLNLKILKTSTNWLTYTRQLKENDPTRGGGTQRIIEFNEKTFRESLNLDQDSAQKALSFATPAYQAGIALLENINETKVGGSLPAKFIQFFDNLPKLAPQFSGLTLFGNYSNNADDVGGLNIESILSNIGGMIEETDLSIGVESNTSVPMKGILEKAKRGVAENFSKNNDDFSGMTLAQVIDGMRGKSDYNEAEMLAQQKMLHAALVFYTAAAFQGEGGKAISDGDRKFVEWALSYSSISSPQQRGHAIAGMLKIIGKARAVNELLASDSLEDNYAGKNYNKIYGDNVLSAREIPMELLQAYGYMYDGQSEVTLAQATISNEVLKESNENFLNKNRDATMGTPVPDSTTNTTKNISGEEVTNVTKQDSVEPVDIVYRTNDSGQLGVEANADSDTVQRAVDNALDSNEANKIILNFSNYELTNPFAN